MSKFAAPFVVGLFRDPHTFLEACAASRDANHAGRDGILPFPIHGFDKALGMKRSWIGRVVLTMLLIGAFGGFMMQLWMMKYDWPQVIGGKPFNSWPAFVVITFESGIICGTLTTFFTTMLVCNLYPRPKTVVLSDDFTDDCSALVIPVTGNGDEASLKKFMLDHGADQAVLVNDEGIPLDAPTGAAEPHGAVADGAHH